MYTFCGTRIRYCVMDCHWTFTVGYMSPFCIVTKCFIPIQNEPLWVYSVYEGISKVLIELQSIILKVFQNMCYDTLILPSIITFFFLWEEFMWRTSTCNYLDPAVLSSLLHLITPCPQYSIFQSPTALFNKTSASFNTKNFFQVSAI